MIDKAGPIEQRQISREFQGVMPEVGSVAFVASIVREGLEAAHYPEFPRLIELPDDWLVQQIELVSSVPDDVWIRGGFVPLGDWKSDHE